MVVKFIVRGPSRHLFWLFFLPYTTRARFTLGARAAKRWFLVHRQAEMLMKWKMRELSHHGALCGQCCHEHTWKVKNWGVAHHARIFYRISSQLLSSSHYSLQTFIKLNNFSLVWIKCFFKNVEMLKNQQTQIFKPKLSKLSVACQSQQRFRSTFVQVFFVVATQLSKRKKAMDLAKLLVLVGWRTQ